MSRVTFVVYHVSI